MSISVDPARRAAGIRRARKAGAEPTERSQESEAANLPVPVGPVKSIPAGPAGPGGDAAIHAQVIGERRGLRAGPTIHDEARSSYNRTEWSGARDRRAPKGKNTKTDV
jgi:hypothetical protein